MGAAEKKYDHAELAKQEWFTTTEAAAYIRTTPKALRQRIARGSLKPDSWGGRGRGREHMFRRATLDAHCTVPA
jgi:hypothetical protein